MGARTRVADMAGSGGGLGRTFWGVFGAGSVSGVGDGLRYAALPLLAASLTRDPRLVSLVSVADYLPAVLFGLLSGAVADRMDRRRLMWVTDLSRAAVGGGFFALLVAGRQSIWLAVAVTFVMGGFGIFFENASSSILPMLVAREDLERANGLVFTSQNVTSQFVGMPLGGLLFTVSAALPFGVDAVTFVGSCGLLLFVRGRFHARPDGSVTRIREDIAEGLRWLSHHRLLRTLALLLTVVNGAFAAAEAVLVLYVLQVLRLPSVGYPLLLVALAVGAVIGALLAGRLRDWFTTFDVVLGALVAMVAALLALGLTSSVVVSVLALALVGGAGMAWNVVTVSLRQAIVPDRLLGRVTSAYRVVGLGAMPVGAALGGLLGHAYGLHAPYLIAAAALALAALLSIHPLRSAAAKLSTRPLEPTG